MTILMHVCFVLIAWRGRYQRFWGPGGGDIYFSVTGEQRSIFEGTRESTILENRKHKKTSAGPRGPGDTCPPTPHPTTPPPHPRRDRECPKIFFAHHMILRVYTVMHDNATWITDYPQFSQWTIVQFLKSEAATTV